MDDRKNKRKKVPAPAIVSVFSVFLVIMALIFVDRSLREPDRAVSAVAATTGHIDVAVVDGLSGAPLEDALVVIPEANIQAATDSNGQTGPIQLPVLQNANYQDFAPQPWGEVTLLVYHPDYIPYAIFHAQVFDGQQRDGPKVYLFKQGDAPSDQPFSIVEGPQRDWVNELLEEYNPS